MLSPWSPRFGHDIANEQSNNSLHFAHFYVMNFIFKEIFDHSKIQWKGQKCPVHPLPPHMYKLPHYQ